MNAPFTEDELHLLQDAAFVLYNSDSKALKVAVDGAAPSEVIASYNRRMVDTHHLQNKIRNRLESLRNS